MIMTLTVLALIFMLGLVCLGSYFAYKVVMTLVKIFEKY